MNDHTISRPAKNLANTRDRTPGGNPLLTDQCSPEHHEARVGEHPLSSDQQGCDTQRAGVAGHLLDPVQPVFGTQSCTDAVDTPATSDQGLRDNHTSTVAGGTPPPPTPTTDVASATPPPSGWEELRICADLFDRAQAERIATCNLLGIKADGTPAVTGARIDPTIYGQHLELLIATENAAKLILRRCYKRVVPTELRQLQQRTPGLGTDSFARILGRLGDPYIATPHWWEGTGSNRTLMQGEPYVRTIAQLWQYCGHGKPGRVTKGMDAAALAALGSPSLKMLVHLQAEWLMRQTGKNGQRSPYRDLYERTRLAVEDKVHSVECVRCGPAGKPAQPGTPWSAGHQHAHALRIIGKELLREMWLVRHQAETGITEVAA